MITKKKLINLFFYIAIVFLMASSTAGAQNLKNAFGPDSQLDKAAGGSAAGYDIEKYQVEPIIGAVIQAFLSILGIIFLILMIYAGYSWMTARGDEQKVTKAKETITAAIIGLVIVIGAYALTFFVISKLTADTLK